jgi:quercetin dioxygenase-like cupin family protein
MQSAIVVPAGEGELLGSHIVVKLERPELSVNEVAVGPDFGGAGPHYHEHHVDAFYVLEGALEILCGSETVQAPAGTSVAVPPGIVHGFTSSEAHERTRYLNIHSPDSGFIEYIRQSTRGGEASWDSVEVDEPHGPTEADVVEAGGGERLEADERTITVRAAHPQLCFLEFEAREGFGPIPPHQHDAQIDSFYVLEGELGLWADGGERRFGPGTFVAAPPGEEHGILRVESPVRFLNFHAPDAGFAAFIRGA